MAKAIHAAVTRQHPATVAVVKSASTTVTTANRDA